MRRPSRSRRLQVGSSIVPPKSSRLSLPPRTDRVLVTGIARHADSPTSNAAQPASVARSQRLVLMSTHMAAMVAILTTDSKDIKATTEVITDMVLIITEEATVQYLLEQVTGDAVLKAAHTTTSRRMLIAFDAELLDQVLLLLSTSPTRPPWPLHQSSAWARQVLWAALLVLRLLVLALKPSVLVLPLLNLLQTPTVCRMLWVHLAQAFLRWAA